MTAVKLRCICLTTWVEDRIFLRIAHPGYVKSPFFFDLLLGHLFIKRSRNSRRSVVEISHRLIPCLVSWPRYHIMWIQQGAWRIRRFFLFTFLYIRREAFFRMLRKLLLLNLSLGLIVIFWFIAMLRYFWLLICKFRNLFLCRFIWDCICKVFLCRVVILTSALGNLHTGFSLYLDLCTLGSSFALIFLSLEVMLILTNLMWKWLF